jgi:hypothetical protein
MSFDFFYYYLSSAYILIVVCITSCVSTNRGPSSGTYLMLDDDVDCLVTTIEKLAHSSCGDAQAVVQSQGIGGSAAASRQHVKVTRAQQMFLITL